MLASLFFANKVGHQLTITSRLEAPGVRRNEVQGQVFFSSTAAFLAAFDFMEVLDDVRIGLKAAQFRDVTVVAAQDRVVLRYRRKGVTVQVLDQASATLVDLFGIHDKPGAGGELLGY